ncbi:hypothetical protein EGW08_010754 [Elysia chlorotica]|uniref:Uncharacterized protein n=1 Tax=Elysia chlorotica TaxID=188477 RepID=A0A433TIU0_ELYCH|nr:hypothetical protein EGW08_010754 [Elysia chlorotica]
MREILSILNTIFPLIFVNQSDHAAAVTCSFESSLQGDWLSNRKGELTISADRVSGFEPYGLTCTNCSGQPTDFECYQQSGSMYLIRSARTFLNGLSVRIYVCLDMTFVSSTKYIYYQAHSAMASDLEDYLTVLNAAQPVNALTEVCTQPTPYPAQLHSVLLSAGEAGWLVGLVGWLVVQLPGGKCAHSLSRNRPSYTAGCLVQSGASACPEDFASVFNTSVSSCDFTLSSCGVDSQLKLSTTACASSPFYTASPQSGASACPEDFASVYNTSVSSCDFTLSSCGVDSQLKLSTTACASSPFYTERETKIHLTIPYLISWYLFPSPYHSPTTPPVILPSPAGGIVSCIYSLSDGGTTYLTLLNHDSSVDGNNTFQFTCIVSILRLVAETGVMEGNGGHGDSSSGNTSGSDYSDDFTSSSSGHGSDDSDASLSSEVSSLC